MNIAPVLQEIDARDLSRGAVFIYEGTEHTVNSRMIQGSGERRRVIVETAAGKTFYFDHSPATIVSIIL